MTTAVATKPAGISVETGDKMKEAAREIEATYANYKSEAYGQVEDSIALALCLVKIREKMASILPLLRALYNTELGFKCDRPNKDDNRPYDDATVIECACVAVLKGVRITGNMFNIIASKTYITKEGYQFKLGRLPGLADFVPRFGLPTMNGGGALVKTKATWKFHGKDGIHEQEFAVRLNAGMGADGALGKAKRKLYAHVFDVLTGFALPDTDSDDHETIIGQVGGRTDALAGQLGIDQAKQEPANLPADAAAAATDKVDRVLIEGKAIEDTPAENQEAEPPETDDPQFILPPPGNDTLLKLLHQYRGLGLNCWDWLGIYNISNVTDLANKKAKERTILCTALSARLDELKKEQPGLFKGQPDLAPLKK